MLEARLKELHLTALLLCVTEHTEPMHIQVI